MTRILGAALITALCFVGSAWAQQRTFDIPATEAVKGIPEFARQAGIQIVAPADHLKGVKTPAVKGELDAREALKQLLIGTGLHVASDDGTVITLRRVSGESARAVPDDRMWLEEIVVTGSRIKRPQLESPTPILVFDRQFIERSGASTASDLLRRLLPIQTNSVTDFSSFGNVGTGQSNINLRGLGGGATLTLVNGRRFAISGNSRIQGGNVYNINSIPMAAVERIEVLKDGASAIYGSDAIAGVVNFILREDFTGTELQTSYANTFETDAPVITAAATLGFSSEQGQGLLTIEAYKQNGMLGPDRSFSSTADQRHLGGPDRRTFPGVRGTVFAMPGQSLPGVTLPNGQPATFAAIPAGQDGSGLTPADFNSTAGVRDLINQNEFSSIVPERETLNFTGAFERDLADEVEVFGQASYSHTNSFNFIYNTQVTQGQLIVPASNPYNPFGVPVRIEKNLATEFDGGRRGNDYDDYGVVAGLRGPYLKTWEWEVAATYGESNTTMSWNPYNQPAGAANAALTDPARAFNWFGDPSTTAVNGGSQISAIQGHELGRGRGRLSLFDGSTRGDLWSLPAGALKGAIGVEYRRDHYQQAVVSDAVDPATNTFTGVIQRQDRKVMSAFAELNVPVVGRLQNVPAVHGLEVSLAGRYEDLDTFGTTFDPRVSLRFSPFRALALRASWGTSFRAPTANELGNTVVSSGTTITLADPRRGSELTQVVTRQETLSLDPETSKNFSAGLVFEPELVSGLSLAVDYYRLDYDGKFAIITAQQALQLESIFGELITRAEPAPADVAQGWPGRLVSIRSSFVNVSTTRVEGVDFDVRYGRETRIGKFDWNLIGTYGMHFRDLPRPGAAPIERVGTFGFPKKWQGNSSIFWTRGDLGVGLTYRHVAAYDWDGFGVFTPARQIEALKEFDLQTSYELPAGLHIAAGVINLLDEPPPFFAASSSFTGVFGYDNGIASPRGATYYATLKKLF